jgi:hypothetical protein
MYRAELPMIQCRPRYTYYGEDVPRGVSPFARREIDGSGGEEQAPDPALVRGGRGDAAVTAEVVAPDHRMDGQPLGPQGVQQYAARIMAAFPDWRVTVHDLVGEGDWVAARLTCGGTRRWCCRPGAGPRSVSHRH